jgi:apolipoprotein D and lipocalin family protein
MKKRTVAAGLIVAAVAGIAGYLRITAGPIGNARVPEPARPVDIDRYAGRWYEIARYENRFEKGLDGVTADYALLRDGRVGVTNTGYTDPAFRQRRQSTGHARIVPDSGNAKLKVSFFGPFYVGNYWVLDHAEDYAWSIVGEPSGRFLWILAREAHPDGAQIDDLLGRVVALGYDPGLIRRTSQP